jgi:hypothetical protein
VLFWLWAVLAWLGFAVLAVACGAIRVKLLEPLTGPGTAHILGTLAVCTLFLLLIGRFVAWTGARETSRLLLLGGVWTAMTMAFEFGFGHYVMGHPWERLLADYNLFAGRIWLLVLLTMGLGPVLAARLNG